jgi:hypothetical protein
MRTLDLLEQIWPRIWRLLAPPLGIFLAIYNGVIQKTDRPWLYAFSLALLGLPVARTLEKIVAKLSGEDPEKPEAKDETLHESSNISSRNKG